STALTYSRLDALSDHVAAWLRRLQCKPETLVGVYSGRSCQTIIAFLAILKAGLAYLPFDPQVPATRMQNILSSVGGDESLVLVGQDQQHPQSALSHVRFVRIQEILDQQSKPNASFASVGSSPDASLVPSPQSLA